MASTSSSLNMNIGDTLYLANIPQAENSISNLINYFCKFGVVKNVHVAYNGDPAASKITFDSNDAAKVAYNNQEAILNNRFISMSWNSPTSGAEPTPVTDQSIGVNCSLCMRVFENTKVRDNHIKRIHNGKGYTCGECNVPFATIKTYNSHVISQRHGSLVQTNFKQTVKSERTPMKVDKLALFTFENQRLRDKKHALKHRLHEIEKVHSKELKKEKEHFETKLKEKDAALLTLQQKVTTLDQDLQDARRKVRSIEGALLDVCNWVRSKRGTLPSFRYLRQFLSANRIRFFEYHRELFFGRHH